MSELVHPFAIDYDGVMVEKLSTAHLLRNTTKMGLATIPGAIEGVQFLNDQQDMRSLGIMTARPKWLREGQTRRDVLRRGFPVETISHSGKYKAKVQHVLCEAVGLSSDIDLDKEPNHYNNLLEKHNIGRIILIDDSVKKIVEGAQELSELRPNLRPLQERLTLFAFGHLGGGREGTIRPGVIHVVGLPDWSSVQNAVKLTRDHHERRANNS